MYCYLTGNFRPGPLSGKSTSKVAFKYWFILMQGPLNPWSVFLVLINPLPSPLMDSAGCLGWRKESCCILLLQLPFPFFSVFLRACGQHPSSNASTLQLVIKKLLTNCKITAVWLVAELMGFLWRTKVQRALDRHILAKMWQGSITASTRLRSANRRKERKFHVRATS